MPQIGVCTDDKGEFRQKGMCTQLPFAHEEFAIEPGLCAVHKRPFRPLYVLQRDFDDLKRIAANREKFPRNEASMRIREIIKKMYR